MREALEGAVDLLNRKNMDYGEARFVSLKKQILSTKNGRMGTFEEKETEAIGIRLLARGAWGFASTRDLSQDSLQRGVKRALDLALVSSKTNRRKVRLVPEPAHRDFWETKIEIDPWKVSLHEKADYLLECDHRMRQVPGIKITDTHMEFARKHQIFASTEGAWIESIRYFSGGGIQCQADDGRERERRSYPGPSWNFKAQGYEAIRKLDLLGHAEKTAREARLLLHSPRCPQRKFDLILQGAILALQIHESIGHAAELDRVYGYEDNLGGRTYLTPEKLHRLRLGSRAVNIVAHAAGEEREVGSILYDDEGVRAKATEVVKNGIFSGYLSSRETAHYLGLRGSNGSMIAEDGSFLPLIRITSLNLLPGKASMQELIESTDEGLLLDAESSWSIDEERDDFQIGAEIAWHIRKGRIVGAFKKPLYRSRSIDFWRSCEAVANAKDYAVWGFSDCGKGGPFQHAYVSHGSSPAKFRGIQCYSG